MSKASAIFSWVKIFAPLILANIPATRAIAGDVAAGIDEAEQIGGAGSQKLTHVVNIGKLAADAINQEKPGAIDPATLDTAITEGVNTAFAIAALAQASHGAPAAPPETPAPTAAVSSGS